MNENNQKVKAEETVQMDQNVESVAETKKGFLAWIRSHKTELILAGVSITTIIGVILGLKNKEALAELWAALSKSITMAPTETAATVSVATAAPVLETVASTRAYTPPTEAFDVSRHIRTMAEGWHHSAEKAAEAAALGIELLPNQTLVGPYTKGAA